VKHHVEVVVRLKEGLLDPQGKAIEDALPHLGWTNVSEVRVGKHIELTVEADDVDTAHSQIEDIGNRLLANPVIETVEVRWEGLQGNRIEIGARQSGRLEAEALE
jgi:phosphoribosylformylglycinamidine synthase PurS subunit